MRRILTTAIALAIAGVSANATAQDGPASPSAFANAAAQTTTQLPRSVRPSHYDVSVTPHADKLAFDGQVAITVNVLQATDRIVLNALDMTFAKVSLTPATGGGMMTPKVSVDADAQTASFAFDQPLAPGQYVLSMAYTGRIGTQANGLFALDYDTLAGRKRALFTQFENSDARRFIPCWDEPAYKATFTLKATVPSAQMAVSNMPVGQGRDLGNGSKLVAFAESPKMSTYLLFFAVGDFDRAAARQGDTELGVITQKGKTGQAAFALQSQVEILREYNDYFGVPYPLPKLDNVAAPGRSQFFGAMENWGAIFTFEHALLLDPAISTQDDRQSVFSIDAHEMAHQWFGDLVTMGWWDDLWLNEGFASWMEGRTTAKLHPEWSTALDAVGVRERAMTRDAVATTHPVVQKIETVEQASQAFDAITYSKGESVIGMLEGYVGADAWREGVRRYIKAHAYGNTVSDDLWKQIEAAAGKPVTAIAHDFTLQPGVPMVRVDSATCVGGSTRLQLSQGEFTRDRPGKQALRWRVPVIAQTVGGAPARTLLQDGAGTLTVPGCGTLIVNAGQTGYYRTQYGPAQFAAIVGGFSALAPIDQLGVMENSWALGMAGVQPATDVLDLVAATPADAQPQVWSEIADVLSSLHDYYRGDSARQARFDAFALATLRPVLARVGWEARSGEPAPRVNLRPELITTLGDLGDPQVIAEAMRRYAAEEHDQNAMPAALRKTILSVVARNASAATWDRLHAQARAETTPLVKDNLYRMLSVAADPALAQRALALALTDEPGATNSAGMIEAVSGEHPDLAFDFAVAHRSQVDRLVDSTSRSRYYPGLASGSTDPAMVARIRAYANQYVAPGSRRAADTAIASIQYRAEVRDKRMPAIDAWLHAHGRG